MAKHHTLFHENSPVHGVIVKNVGRGSGGGARLMEVPSLQTTPPEDSGGSDSASSKSGKMRLRIVLVKVMGDQGHSVDTYAL